jgi:hypothetical protein
MARRPSTSPRTTLCSSKVRNFSNFAKKIYIHCLCLSFGFTDLTGFIVGDGATSVVVKACRNKDINDAVAIKKVKRVFEHTAFAHRAMRELRLLRCLGNHENVSSQ